MIRIGLGPVARTLAAVATVSIATVASAAELKLAHFMPPQHVMHGAVLEPLANELSAATDGALTIRIFPSGELGQGPQQQYQRAVEGVADITFGLQGYTSNLFPRTMLAELPGIAETPEEATEMMWRAFDDHLAEEYKGTRVLGIWANDLAVIMTTDKPVRTLDDLAGLKIRTPSAQQARILETLGAVPVPMPVTKVYTSLQTGVIDGVMIGPCAIPAFKLNEVVKHYTINPPLAVTTFFTVMNQRSWDALDEAQRSALAELTGRDWSIRAAAAYADCGRRGLDIARQAENSTVIELPAGEIERWRAAVQPVVMESIAALEADGIPGRAIADQMGIAR